MFSGPPCIFRGALHSLDVAQKSDLIVTQCMSCYKHRWILLRVAILLRAGILLMSMIQQKAGKLLKGCC